MVEKLSRDKATSGGRFSRDFGSIWVPRWKDFWKKVGIAKDIVRDKRFGSTKDSPWD